MNESRLHPDTVQVLATAGWSPGRDVGTSVDEWVAEIRSGPESDAYSEIPAAVRSMLGEFGGLHVEVSGPGRTMARSPFTLDPREHILRPIGYARLARLLDTVTYPLGVVHDQLSALAGDSEGRVFMLAPAGDELVGRDIHEALDNLVLGISGTVVDDLI